jgi:MFS family permease
VAYPIITLYMVGQDVSKASEVTGWIFMVNAAVLLVGSILVGMLADKFSRKVVIVTVMAINVVFYFLQSTFTVFWMSLPFYLSRAFIPCAPTEACRFLPSL